MAASWQAAGSLAAPRRASHRTAMAQRSRAQPLPKVSPPGPPRGFMDPPAVSASPLIAGHLPKASHQRSMMFTIGTRSNSESAAEFPVRPTMRQKGTPNTQIHRSRMIQCQMLNAPFRSPRWLVGALPCLPIRLTPSSRARGLACEQHPLVLCANRIRIGRKDGASHRRTRANASTPDALPGHPVLLNALDVKREPQLGAVFGDPVPAAVHGALGYAVVSGATIGQAMQTVARFASMRNRLLSCACRLRDGLATLLAMV